MTRLAYQLYSSRNFPPLGETLKMLAELGYEEVEGYGGLFADDDAIGQLRAGLEATGLKMPTGHFGLDVLEGDPQRVLRIAGEFGLTRIFCPHIAADQRPGDAAGWVPFGRRLEAARKPFHDAGYAFGWHNHAFEFEAVDGVVPMEAILQGGPSLDWEADIAWIVRGGGDPLDWIGRHGNRISAVHVKDIAPEGECADEDGWADVGHGIIDWKELFRALAPLDVPHYVMEHDNPSDDRRFAERSIAAVRKKLEETSKA